MLHTVCVALALVATLATAQTSPWVNQTCDNSLFGLGGSFPALSGFYYVQLYSSPSTSTSNITMIVSLCNKTNKTPRQTSSCGVSTFFVAVWSASTGACLGAYDTITATSTVKNFNGTGGPAYTLTLGTSTNATASYVYRLGCAFNGADQNNIPTIVANTTYMLQETQDLCTAASPTTPTPPTPPTPVTPSPKTSHGGSSHAGKVAAVVAALLLWWL